MMLSIFMWLLAICVYLEKCPSPLLIFHSGWFYCCSSFTYTHKHTRIHTHNIYILIFNRLPVIELPHIFFPFRRLPFHFVNSVLWCTKVLNFGEVLIYFCFWCCIQEIIAKPKAVKPFPYVSSESFINWLALRTLIWVPFFV